MSKTVLGGLAKRFNGKLSRCEIYDANVCTFDSTPDRPWELVLLSGKPFSQRLIFTYKGRKVTTLENGIYVNGRVTGTFSTEPFSINSPQKAGFRSEWAGNPRIGAKLYSVFSGTGELSGDQESLVAQPEIISFVEEVNLQEGELLYFTKGEIGFYLKQPTTELVILGVESLVDLAEKIDSAKDEPNLNSLPVQFHPLIPLIQKWAVGDDSERNDLLAAVTTSVLSALIEEVKPYLDTIDSYLDSFQSSPPPDQAIALGRLAECALEAQRLSEKKRVAGTTT